MPKRSARPLAPTVFAALVVVATAACSQQAVTPAPPPASDAKVEPLNGKLPPFCESCGTVIAINRVDTPAPPKLPGSAPLPAKPASGDRFEVVIRLNAGTQQIIMLDETPQVTVGQRVRITDGIIVPDLG